MRRDRHGGDRRPISPCSGCSSTPTSSPTISGSCLGRPMPIRISRCRSASRSSPSTTSCIWSTCGAGKAPEYPLDRYALYICVFSAGDRRAAGALVGGDAPVRPEGLRAGLAAPVRARRHLHRDRPDREDRCSAIRSDASSIPIYAQAKVGPGAGWRMPGSRSASPSRFSSISPAIPTSRSGSACCSASAAVQFQCAVPLDQHPGFLAALAHDADDVPARLSVSSARQLRASAAAPLLLQYFAAMILTMALCGLWHGPSWTFVLWGTLHGCALVVRLAVAPLRLPRCRRWLGWALTVVFVLLTGVIFRAGTLEAAWNIYQGLAILPNLEQRAHLWPIMIAAAVRVPAAGKPGHRRAVDASAKALARRLGRPRSAGDPHRTRRPGRPMSSSISSSECPVAANGAAGWRVCIGTLAIGRAAAVCADASGRSL